MVIAGINADRTDQTRPQNNIRVSKEKKRVSILNFCRQSKKVIFTEPATIEAINRLGFEMSEFDFISPENFNSSSDPNLTDTLYQKYLNKRQKMIEQTIKMRETILDEQKYPIPKSPVVRREEIFLKKQQNRLEQIDDDSNYAFRKLALNRLHDIMKYQNNYELNQKISNKFRDIDEVNKMTSDFITNIRSNDAEKPQKESNKLNAYQNGPYSKLREIRLSQLEKLQTTHYRRENKTNLINERRALIEQQNHEFFMRKIQEKDERFKLSSEAYRSSFLGYLKDKKKFQKSRAKSAKIRKEELCQRHIDETYELYKSAQIRAEQRMEEINREKAYNAAIRKNKDKEKMEKIRHSFNARKHENEMERKKIKEDESGVELIKEEEKNVIKEMSGANLRVSQKRARLNKAFDNLASPDDIEGLNRIQRIMGLNDDQMNELVFSACNIDKKTLHNRKT